MSDIHRCKVQGLDVVMGNNVAKAQTIPRITAASWIRVLHTHGCIMASATLFFGYNISYITVKVSSTFAISDRRRLSSINGSLQTAYKP